MFEMSVVLTACPDCFTANVNVPIGGKLEKVPDFNLTVALAPVDGRQPFTLSLPANEPATRRLLTQLAKLADQSFADGDAIQIEFVATKSRAASSA